MKLIFLAVIFFLGCSLNYSRATPAALPERPELKVVFLKLQTLKPSEAVSFIESQGFLIGEGSNRKTRMFTGRLDGDSMHIFVQKKRRRSANVKYRIEIIKNNVNWNHVKDHIYSMEDKLKNWLNKSPIYRVTQAPKICLGMELKCLKLAKMEYKISWLYVDIDQREVFVELYLNESANIVIYLNARR